MPQLTIGRPLSEFDFSDELGFYPGNAAAFVTPGRILKWRLVDRPLLEFGEQLAEGLRREAGADLARVDQIALFVVADEERAEPNARPFGLRVAADDELLLLDTFDFEPIWRAVLVIGAVSAFGDDAFHCTAARVLQNFVSGALDVIAV